MNDPREDDPIDVLLDEAGFGGDEALRGLLIEARTAGTAVEPLPTRDVARLLGPAVRRATRPRRHVVVALVVGATVLTGTAAAASPLSPLSGTVVLGGLLGGGAPGVPAATQPPDAGNGSPGLQSGADAHDPSPSATVTQGHPTPSPARSHRPTEPGPASTHPAPPPHPHPRSTEAAHPSHP